MRTRRFHWSPATRTGRPARDHGRRSRRAWSYQSRHDRFEVGRDTALVQFLFLDFALAALMQQLRHKPGPAGLMIRAHTRSGVAVEVFVEEDQVTPVGIFLI